MLSHAGWILANIAIPYLFPLALIRLLQSWSLNLTDEQMERARLTYLLREAQLSIASVAIASAATYDLLSNPLLLHEPAGVTLAVVLILLAALNAILFVCGTVIGSPPPQEAVQAGTTVRQWLKAYRMAASSLYMAVAVSVCAFSAHVLTDEMRGGRVGLPTKPAVPSTIPG